MKDFNYNQDKINSAICCLMDFKKSYKENNGTITIGDIRDLINNIDFIEKCVKKQKYIPTNAEKHFKLFGKMEWVEYCPSCSNIIHSGKGQRYCSNCGQKIST
ncbi:MAG: hypothetical protein ACI4S1_16385 [Roseburia sp.]